MATRRSWQEVMAVKQRFGHVLDKRRHRRVPFSVQVNIVRHLESGDKSDKGICTDISESGVRIDTKADLRIDDVVELVFYGKHQDIFCNYARILYRSGNSYGACFARCE